MSNNQKATLQEASYMHAHKHCSGHRKEVLASELCGCFYCLTTFTPDKIEEWIDDLDDGIGKTALCPECGTDSVIGSKAGFPLTPKFFREHAFILV